MLFQFNYSWLLYCKCIVLYWQRRAFSSVKTLLCSNKIYKNSENIKKTEPTCFRPLKQASAVVYVLQHGFRRCKRNFEKRDMYVQKLFNFEPACCYCDSAQTMSKCSITTPKNDNWYNRNWTLDKSAWEIEQTKGYFGWPIHACL